MLILVTLEVSHFEISGKESNELQFLNNLLILVTIEVFQFEISGNSNNESHSQNILLIFVTFFIPFNIISNLPSLFSILSIENFSCSSYSLSLNIILQLFLLFKTKSESNSFILLSLIL